MIDCIAVCDEIRRQLLLSPKVRAMRGINGAGLHVVVASKIISRSVFSISQEGRPEERHEGGHVEFSVSVTDNDGSVAVRHIFTEIEMRLSRIEYFFIADLIVRKFNGQASVAGKEP